MKEYSPNESQYKEFCQIDWISGYMVCYEIKLSDRHRRPHVSSVHRTLHSG